MGGVAELHMTVRPWFALAVFIALTMLGLGESADLAGLAAVLRGRSRHHRHPRPP